MHLVNILRIITFSFLVGHSILTISDFNSFRFFGTPCISIIFEQVFILKRMTLTIAALRVKPIMPAFVAV